MTAFHFSVSPRRKSATSCGDPPVGTAPSFRIFSARTGSATAPSISELSRSMMAFGVPAGARITSQLDISTSGIPASMLLGTSVRAGDRALPVTASAFSVPDAMKLISPGAGIDGKLDISRQQILQHGRTATIGNMLRLQAGFHGEQGAAEMPGGAHSGAAEIGPGDTGLHLREEV